MSGINLNNSEEFVKEFKVFNDGKAGIVDNVKMRVEKKANSDTDDKKPNYKLIATDSTGAEINEGFYYQADDSKAFLNYQAGRLINLARGVFGKDVKFQEYQTAKETLDGVMKMVAQALATKPWRIAACYGTTKHKESYMGFKQFGSFIQPMNEENTLAFDRTDNLERAPLKDATTASELVSGMTKTDTPAMEWMNEGK